MREREQLWCTAVIWHYSSFWNCLVLSKPTLVFSSPSNKETHPIMKLNQQNILLPVCDVTHSCVRSQCHGTPSWTFILCACAVVVATIQSVRPLTKRQLRGTLFFDLCVSMRRGEEERKSPLVGTLEFLINVKVVHWFLPMVRQHILAVCTVVFKQFKQIRMNSFRTERF
jgi:hypothetical protein